MSAPASKPVRSPSYPNMSLRNAVAAVRKIETRYRTTPIDRTDAAKLIGYSSLSGPANKALGALASYGLVDRAGKGLMRVTGRATAILHPKNDDELRHNLREAALEPQLFQELRERFDGVETPPEEGVVSHLNRQGFNQSAIRPAARAFLETLDYLEEAGVSESYGPDGGNGAPYSEPAKDDGRVFGGAKVGDLVQWESQGTLRLEKPLRVRAVTDDGQWVAVEGSQTGIPMSEVLVEHAAPVPPAKPPHFPFDHRDASDDEQNVGTDLRFKVGKGIVVKVSSREELGVAELDKLVTLLQAQSVALKD